MSDGTHIEWVKGPDGRKGATWNPITGCSLASPGCTNCYAMKLAGTRLRDHPSRAGLTTGSKAGPVWTGEVRFNKQWLTQPLQWKRPRMIFVCAHGDLFHESVPDAWIDRVFAVMALCPQHTFQVLTKRADRMREYMASIENGDERLVGDGWRGALIEGMAQSIWHDRTGDDSVAEWLAVHLPLPNVWLGVSVEDQARADERIPHLLATPAAVRWISAEPLLAPVDLTSSLSAAPWELTCSSFSDVAGVRRSDMSGRPHDGIDWVVCGGESGAGARPMHPDWARSLRDQCAAAGVPFFFKQWGEWGPLDAFGAASDRPVTDRYGNVRDWMNRYVVCADRADRLRGHSFTEHATDLVYKVGKKRAGRLLDGQLHDAMPQVRA